MPRDKQTTLININIAAAILIYLVIVGMFLSCNIVMLAQAKPDFRFTPVISADAATFNAAILEQK